MQSVPPIPANGSAMERLRDRVDQIAREFLRADPVNTAAAPCALADRFAETRIPAGALGIDEYLDRLRDDVVAHAPRTSSPLYIGHMTTALPWFVRPLAELVAVMNQNLVKIETSKSFTLCERQTLAMMHRLVYGAGDEFYGRHAQNGDSTLGAVTSGGTLANLTALWCARNAALGPSGTFPGVDEAGVAAALRHHGCTDAVIVGSELMHYSIAKAADLLGIGARNTLRVRVDAECRADLGELRRVVDECRRNRRRIVAIVGVAGTTDAGSIDPLREMAALARSVGCHFHVDAAWGGALLLSRTHRGRLAGIEQADSVTIDGHKQLLSPIGTGLVLFRDPGLARTIEKRARYILRRGTWDLGKRSVEGSRSAAILFLHAALHILGTDGFEQMVDGNLRRTAYMAARIGERPEFELLTRPQMNILLYRALPPAFTRTPGVGDGERLNVFNVRLQKEQRRRGRSFVSRTSLERGPDGAAVVALRAVLANPLTADAHIDGVLDEQAAIAAGLPS
jgi:glutamate decarboxylase